MVSYDDIYEIRLAQKEEIPAIMSFIKDCWSENHIMARDRALFEYEFAYDNEVNMVIAKRHNSDEIEGIFGFLYSSNDKEKRDIWGSIWKVREGNKALLGVEILRRMVILSKCRYSLDVGANTKTTVPIVKRMLNYCTDKMNQYYILSDKYKGNFKIAKVTNYCFEKELVSDKNYDVHILDRENIKKFFDCSKIELDEMIPYKDYWLIERKYLNHPQRKYKVYGIFYQNQIKGLIIIRVEHKDDRAAVRFVDYIGDEKYLEGTKVFWKNLLIEQNAEYVDFYEHGFDSGPLEKAGFIRRVENDSNIIPNYFSPFIQENVDIWTYSSVNGYRACKADGDQDRPN